MTSSHEVPTESCDICVIGTGAGGGILAYRLAMAGMDVLSIEQGNEIRDAYFTNDLSGEDQPYFGIFPEMSWPLAAKESYLHGNPQTFRLYAKADTLATSESSANAFVNRQIYALNGKLNTWNGVSLRMAPRDFRAAEVGDGSCNWPIGYHDLESYYSSVEQLVGVCGTREGIENLPDGDFIPPLPLRPIDRLVAKSVQRIRGANVRAIPARKAIETRHDRKQHCRSCGECVFGCRFGSVFKFSSRLLPHIEGKSNYRIRYHTKVAKLTLRPDSNLVDTAECIDSETGRRWSLRARVFVSAAGAIESPRLLLNSTDSRAPNGLANHSGLVGCYLQDKVRAMVASPLFRLLGSKPHYEFNCNDHLLIPRFLFEDGLRGGFQAQVCHVLPRRPYYIEGLQPFPGWSRKWIARGIFGSLAALLLLGKPEASRANRLVPSGERDAFGVPKVHAEYSFSENDLRLRDAMIKYGRLILWKCSGWMPTVFDDDLPGATIHYAGTCRMAATADEGVVGRELRCFDHPNLYLCDGSVFPEVSEKNLTLTIMALAERLASHLQA
ncbi:MAG: GMC family oxidoreductase [Candidatus Paceibacterota bacterium]